MVHVAAVCVIGAALVLGFFAGRRRVFPQLQPADLSLALALLAALFHLFAAMGLVLVFAVARYDLWRISAQPRRRLVTGAPVPSIKLPPRALL